MAFTRINLFSMRPLTKMMTDEMKAIGITDYNVQAGRSPVLEEKEATGFIGRLFSSGTDVAEDPVDFITFLIPSEKEDAVLQYLVEKGKLMMPGRGSVYSEEIEIPKAHASCAVNQLTDFETKSCDILNEITGLCCIVQRGQGDVLSRLALETGVGTPNITYGSGAGIRDKMSLVRITIPAEKELIWMAMSRGDAEMVMSAMIKAGELDLPGKGFIYLYPLRKGVLDMQVTRGIQRAAASVEQMVAAIDHLYGSVEWRKRAELSEGGGSKRTYLTDLTELIDFTLVCDEGGSDSLVAAAMAAGVPAVTVSKVKHICPDDSEGSQLAKSRETCNMILSPNDSSKILEALEQAEAFTDKYHGQVLFRKVAKAFTYLPPKK